MFPIKASTFPWGTPAQSKCCYRLLKPDERRLQPVHAGISNAMHSLDCLEGFTQT